MPSGIPGLPQPAGRAWQGVAGTLLLLHAALALAVVLLRRSWPALNRLVSGSTLQSFALGGILMQGALILLPTILVITAGKLPATSLLGGKARAGSLILAFTAGIPAAVVFQGMNNLLVYFLIKSGISLPQPALASLVSGTDLFQRPWPAIVMITLVSVVMPGLIEELMFRGVILASFSSAGATASAVFWQAAAFAVFHSDPLFLLPPFLAGLLLALIRRRSDSLLPAILAHMSLNFSLLAIGPLLPRLTSQYLVHGSGQANSLLYASLIAACVAAVAFVPLLILISHLQVRRPEPDRRLHIWPADWKFGLAFAVLIATMMVENR